MYVTLWTPLPPYTHTHTQHLYFFLSHHAYLPFVVLLLSNFTHKISLTLDAFVIWNFKYTIRLLLDNFGLSLSRWSWHYNKGSYDWKVWRCRSKSILQSWTSNPICSFMYCCLFSTWPTHNFVCQKEKVLVPALLLFERLHRAAYERENQICAIAALFLELCFVHRCEIWKPRPSEPPTPSAMPILRRKCLMAPPRGCQ